MTTEAPDSIEAAETVAATAACVDTSKLIPSAIHLQNILVPLDFSAMSLKALQYAIPFARQFGAKLTLVHVVEPAACTPELLYSVPLSPEDIGAIKKALQEVRTANIPPELPVEIVVTLDLAVGGILEAARQSSADLIITATHGRTGLKHLFLGSTAEAVLRRAPCPILIVREHEHDFV